MVASFGPHSFGSIASTTRKFLKIARKPTAIEETEEQKIATSWNRI